MRVTRALQQAADVEFVGTHAVQRRKSTAQDMEQPVVASSTLNRPDLVRLFHDTDYASVPGRITADEASFLAAVVSTVRTGMDPLGDLHQRAGQAVNVLLRTLDKVVGQAQRRLGPDPREPPQLAGKAIDGRHARVLGLACASRQRENSATGC